MSNLTITDYFVFNALSFNLGAVYGRGFSAYRDGFETNRVSTFSTSGSGSSRETTYDKTIINPDGTATVAHIVESSSGGFGIGGFSSIYISGIQEYNGVYLLYTLDDSASLRTQESQLYYAQNFYNTRNIIVSGANNDYLLGFAGEDILDSGAGHDFVAGGLGDDTLDAGAGDDQLAGGAGADFLDGNAGFDFARYDDSTAGVVVRLDNGVGVNGDANNDRLFNIEGLIGSGNQDFLIGDINSNALLGQAGDDWLFGQGGGDELRGGVGSDQLIGGAGADQLYGEAGNDQFWTLAADFQAGIWDVIYDFGEAADNFDYLRFEGVSASQLIIGDNGGDAVITTVALNYAGGIIIKNFSGAQTLDQLAFA